MFDLNRIYNMSCVEGLKGVDDCSVDLVVTSPPYDTMRQYGGSLGEWCWEVFSETVKGLHRVIKPGGVCVWVVGDQTVGGSESGTSFRQALEFMSCGFNLNDTMIWVKKNPMPQVKQPRYSQVFEYMFVFSKGKPKTFNPIMIPTKCGGQIYDSTCKNIGGESGRVHKTFKINSEKVHGNVFEIAVAQNRGKGKHPAVFPEELVKVHVETWSNVGDLVLDPFMGSGTTGLVARNLGRDFIGFDVNSEYCRLAEKRIFGESTVTVD